MQPPRFDEQNALALKIFCLPIHGHIFFPDNHVVVGIALSSF